MVGQVVGAVAPAVIQSATNDEGIINRLLKIVTIVAVLGALVITAVIIVVVFNIWEAIGGTFEQVTGLFQGIAFFNPITIFTTGVTSLFGFARSR
jgi:uncharacterized BrkB/YihY/UPF0761 family membrane protein